MQEQGPVPRLRRRLQRARELVPEQLPLQTQEPGRARVQVRGLVLEPQLQLAQEPGLQRGRVREWVPEPEQPGGLPLSAQPVVRWTQPYIGSIPFVGQFDRLRPRVRHR